ncbi:D-alanyl-D-alanine carboxypeptidase family protein [Collinsella phocaeensis]|uniref:D-alanyl-D-alanine carboxypeptidase family protein n=1 Tax=Collinsella phocaeensis TaxID=1871016 RepID=UPI00093052C8|nr:D-alanyl-D-alanine carboxypeptidase [Collinsella phocaeensis]
MSKLSARATRAALPVLAVAALASQILACPQPAFASQLDTDAILGIAESERDDDASDRPDIEARNAIVVGSDGTVYFERDADAQVKIASITKVMTAIVALENSSLDDEVVVDHAAATVGQSSADLREGDVLTMEEALRALLVPSGNDAAMAIASTVGAKIDPSSDDPYGVFIRAMNDKSAELGMKSAFTNPHGLDFEGWEADMHSSARDVATLFAYAMQNDDFRALTSTTNNVITVTGSDGAERDITMIERNTILGRDGNIGGKTGGTYEALQCFVGAFSREDGGEIYTVTLGSDGDEQRFADTLALANWYYDHVVAYPLVTSEAMAPDGSALVARVPHAAWTDKTVDATVADPMGAVGVFSLAGPVERSVEPEDITGDVAVGEDVGDLVLTQDGEEVARVDLIAAEDVSAPDPLSWLLVQLDRLVRTVTGEPTVAPPEIVGPAPDIATLSPANG